MYILGNLLAATAKVLEVVLFLYMLIIIFRAILSFVSPDPYNPVVRFLFIMTEPVLYRIRKILPTGGMPLDFSPLIVLLVIFFLQEFLVRTLLQIAHNLQMN